MKVLIVRYTRNCLPRYIYVTVHRKVSLFQPWQSVRGVTPTFNINWCSLPGLMFRSNLLWMGLAGTGGSGRKSLKEDTRCDVKNLGVYIDATLSMVKHIDYTSHSAYIYILRSEELAVSGICCLWQWKPLLSWCVFLFSVDWTTAAPGSLDQLRSNVQAAKSSKPRSKSCFSQEQTWTHQSTLLAVSQKNKTKSMISAVKINTQNRLHVYYSHNSVYSSTENCMRDRIIAWLLQLLLWLLLHFVSLL